MSRSYSHPFFWSRLRGFGFASYAAYLRSPHWADVRRRFSESDREQSCYCCGEPETQLHHKTYERLGTELIDDLVPLCARCHALVHVLERRGDLTLDLTGLLDEARAAVYAEQRAAGTERAAEDYAEAHDPSRRSRLERLAEIERRAEGGDQVAKRALFVIDQRLRQAERDVAKSPNL